MCRDIARKRYMDPETTRSMHINIANIFFNQEQDDSDEISSEHNSGEENGREKLNETRRYSSAECDGVVFRRFGISSDALITLFRSLSLLN